MNYKITISNGKNEIERNYEALTDREYIADQVEDMVETLATDYPKEWDKKRYIPLDNKLSEQELDRLNMLLEDSESSGEFSQRAKEEMGIDKFDAKDVWKERWECYQ